MSRFPAAPQQAAHFQERAERRPAGVLKSRAQLEAFEASGAKTASGRTIHVEAHELGSGEALQAIVDGKLHRAPRPSGATWPIVLSVISAQRASQRSTSPRIVSVPA
jgi:hypothetical protein